jgi:hypothetical protein
MTAAERFPPREVRSLGYLLLIVIAARTGQDHIPRGVPFLEFMNQFGGGSEWGRTLSAAYFVGSTIAFVRNGFSAGCLIAGSALLLKVLGNMGLYSNGRLFDGLLLVLIGLCHSSRGLSLLRAQCVLLYAGSSLSKCLDPDWWDGRFMRSLFEFHLAGPTAEALAPYAGFAGIASIVAEAAIGVLLFTQATRNHGVILGTLFHTGLLLMLNEDFATFYYSVALSAALLFTRLPAVIQIAAPVPARWLPDVSVFSAVHWAPRLLAPLEVRFEHARLAGVPALCFLIVSSLPFLALVFGCAAYCGKIHWYGARNSILAGTLFAGLCLLACGVRSTWKRKPA